MHDNQREHIDARHIQCIPVTAEGEIHTDKYNRTQAPFEIRNAELDYGGIRVQIWKQRGRKLHKNQRKYRCDDQHQQQRRIQYCCCTIAATFAFFAGSCSLHASRDAKNQGLAHEHDEAAKTDGRQCRITQEADHRRVDDVEEILRYHAPDDGQGQAEYAMAACHAHDFFIVLLLGAAALAGDDYDLDFDYLI